MTVLPALLVVTLSPLLSAQERGARRGTILAGESRIVTEADCTAAPLVATIAPKEIGEPVRSVTLQAAWIAATETVPAHCRVDGVFAPVDTAPTARPINFRVILPASWNRRGAQTGRRRHQRHHPEPRPAASSAPVDRRCCSAASPPTAATRAISCRRSAAAAGRRPRRADQDWALNDEAITQLRLRADEEDARRRDGADRAHVRRAAALQLLHRHVAGRARRR